MSDWIPLVVFALFAFFGVLLPRLARRQAKWQRNLPPRDDAGQEVRYEESEAEIADALDGDPDDSMEEDGRPVVWSPPRRPSGPVPTAMRRPAPPPTRPFRQPSPAMLAARAEARTPQAPRSPRSPRSALIRDRADARRGIKLMAVLGPCRAFEPY